MGKSTTVGQVTLQLQVQIPIAELIWINDRDFDQTLQLIRPQTSRILIAQTLLHFCAFAGD
jgi:hypothetical protein